MPPVKMPRPLLWLLGALAVPVVVIVAVPLAALALLVVVPLVVTNRVHAWLLGGADLDDSDEADSRAGGSVGNPDSEQPAWRGRRRAISGADGLAR